MATLDLDGVKIAHFAESFSYFHFGSQKVNTYFAGLLESTIKAIAESRETGQPVSEAKSGWILGQYRRLLSCLFIRSQAFCLLDWMGHLWEGAK